MSTITSKRQLIDLIEKNIIEYRSKGPWVSIKRNKHLIGYKDGEDAYTPITIVDMVLVDLVNYIATYQGLDEAFTRQNLIDGQITQRNIQTKPDNIIDLNL
ncbi:MAG TPA: hypothetical protein VI911_10635 [Patescibacteria group bacterium]|nr:hypothetical protein [Patescibacteria group bacterium]